MTTLEQALTAILGLHDPYWIRGFDPLYYNQEYDYLQGQLELVAEVFDVPGETYDEKFEYVLSLLQSRARKLS